MCSIVRGALGFATLFVLVQFCEQGNTQELGPVVNVFNEFANRTRELPLASMSDRYIEDTRTQTCEGLLTKEDRESAEIVQSAKEIAKIAPGVIESAISVLQQNALNGDLFGAFLEEEKNILEMKELNGNAQEEILRLALIYRRWVATGDPTVVREDAVRWLSDDGVLRGFALLCDEEHSPARNESSASWKTWVWAATKFLGGLAVVGADIWAGAAPPIAAMSATLGGTAFTSGFADLNTLMPNAG